MERVLFDYAKLDGRITEKCRTRKAFAQRLGVTEATLSRKMNCEGYFTQPEIDKSAGILEISQDQIGTYFFTMRVQEIEQ